MVIIMSEASPMILFIEATKKKFIYTWRMHRDKPAYK